MQRITAVLKVSEAMAVRKAVCMAGAEGVVIIPVPFFPRDADWENPSAPSEVQVRLEVMANDIHCGGIVSAIQRVAQAGKIVFDSRHDMLHGY